MENNTKIAVGLAAAVVVGYIVYKSSKPKSQTQSGSTDVTPPDEKKTLGSLATLFDSQEQPNIYQEVKNNTRESINIADLDCDRDGDVRKNCINVKNQLVYQYMPAISFKSFGTVYPAYYSLEKDNMFYEYDVNGNFVRWSPKIDPTSILK